jgi:hypothetical protein
MMLHLLLLCPQIHYLTPHPSPELFLQAFRWCRNCSVPAVDAANLAGLDG